MQNEVNVQRSKLLDDGMLHIELLDGNSYLYSLQELADIIAAQQSVQADGACTCANIERPMVDNEGICFSCHQPRR